MLKVIELFGGIGACTSALKRLNIDFEIVDYVDIDKYAVKSYNAINGTSFDPQDITKYDKDIQADLIMHGSPCQDFSVAGKNAGGDFGSGTRSSLMYETLRIVNKIKPKYVIWENVKNLLSKKHFHNFQNYLDEMTNIGYNSYYKVLNAKDYGIPQNRERVFTISIRKDIDKTFKFPEPEELKLKLKDFLEDNVDEKYFLSDKIKEKILFNYKGNVNEIGIDLNDRKSTSREIASTIKARYDCGYEHFAPGPTGILTIGNYSPSNHQASRIVDSEGIAPTVMENHGTVTATTIKIKNNTKQGYLDAYVGDGIYTNTSNKRGTVQHNMIQALTSFQDKGVIINNYKIRKLTPKECWRLMGFSDEEFEKAEKVNSNTQLYKQAGNSIVVDVLYKILRGLNLC